MFYASLIVGFVAFTVREYALVAPIAVGLTALWTMGRERRPPRAAVLAFIGLIVVAPLFVAWRRTLPGFQNFSLESPSFDSIDLTTRRAVEYTLLLGLLVAPAVLLAGPLRLLRGAWARARWVTLVLGLYPLVLLGRDYLLPDRSPAFLSPYNTVLNEWTLTWIRHPSLIPESLLKPLALLGLLSVAALLYGAIPPVDMFLRRARAGRIATPESPALAMVALATTGFATTTILVSALQVPVYERYVLPLIPLVAILILSSSCRKHVNSTPWTRVAALVALVVLAALGAVHAAMSARPSTAQNGR